MSDFRAAASRRHFLTGSAALIGTTMLAGCDSVGKTPWLRRLLDRDEDANLYVQRLLLSKQRLAPEYTQADISPWFKPNGTSDPTDKEYKALVKSGFKTFRLGIGGLVERPEKFTIASLQSMPARTQITRHDCVEGWSCIGQWKGVPLSALLDRVGLKPQARFLVFYCADTMDEGDALDAPDNSEDDDDSDSEKGGGNAKVKMNPDDPKAKQADTGGKAKGKPDSKRAAPDEAEAAPSGPGARYYESIDLEDAYHPQTILAYEMNGRPLPVEHGAPLRLRVERQLGYKQAKYIMRIDVVDDLAPLGKGGGGYWEDNGYEWYAGI